MTEERITGPYKGKYFIHASVRRIKPIVGLPSILARAEVFNGHPSNADSISVAKVGSDIAAHDVLDALQNAERIAREVIEHLP